jgi:hypothetical protein
MLCLCSTYIDHTSKYWGSDIEEREKYKETETENKDKQTYYLHGIEREKVHQGK